MGNPNFWHIQLHPSDPSMPREEIIEILKKGVIGMGESWEDSNGDAVRYPEDFKNYVQIGDIFLVRHQGPLALVKVTSDVIYNKDENAIDVWFGIYRKVKILSMEVDKIIPKFSEKWKQGMFCPATMGSAQNAPFVKFWYNFIIEENKMKTLVNFLKSNHNIIFHGAPGTGKTYNAQQIAEYMKAKKGLVQFHPSYDYTDFIEGLRPISKDGQLGFKRLNGVFKKFCEDAIKDPTTDYVFIIDEINRGDISKIFGELFFSIDPDKRGLKGKVKTQYQNLIEKHDIFYDGFYVPENVYIIGTMNDIDRSVESMDLAMRRRFAFQEITAEDSQVMFTEEAFTEIDNKKGPMAYSLLDKIRARMNNLNNAIIEPEMDLSTSYQIGAAYFLKLAHYADLEKEEAFQKLWENHLKGLLYEYIRGTGREKEKIDRFELAYKDEEIHSETQNNR